MKYNWRQRCPICLAYRPFHHGFCAGSVGTVISEAMIGEMVDSRDPRSFGSWGAMNGAAEHSCKGCGYTVCSCPKKDSRGFDETKSSAGVGHVAPSGAEVSGHSKWTQEGVPKYLLCNHPGGHGDGVSRATWWTGPADGRCDKHAPDVEPPSRPGWVPSHNPEYRNWKYASGASVTNRRGARVKSDWYAPGLNVWPAMPTLIGQVQDQLRWEAQKRAEVRYHQIIAADNLQRQQAEEDREWAALRRSRKS